MSLNNVRIVPKIAEISTGAARVRETGRALSRIVWEQAAWLDQVNRDRRDHPGRSL